MSEILQTRNYTLHTLDLRVSCPASIAESLDSRFRLLPSSPQDRGTISIDFRAVPHGRRHTVDRPQGEGRAFYELASGEVRYFEASDEIYMTFGEGVRVVARPGLGSASFSVVLPDPVNVFMASHLMFTILLVEMMKRRGCYSMHAAGFSEDGTAILIPGTSGAGKSTLAVTLLRNGFSYLSDDMVFLRRRTNGLEVLGFPEDVDVSERTIDFFPELHFLRQISRTSGWPKKQVRTDEVYGSKLAREARPGAILIPRISGEEASVVRAIGADEALFEIVSNVLLTEVLSCQEHLNILSELVRETRCYRLETGRDFDRIPVLLREILNSSREEVHA